MRLTKVYGKTVRALDALDLSVQQGEIFGFVGPNGAGKAQSGVYDLILMDVQMPLPRQARAEDITAERHRHLFEPAKRLMPEAGERPVVRVDADLQELIPGFLANKRADVQAIRDALEGLDYPALRQLGHRVKGSGASYAFDAIADIGERLEHAANDERADEIGRLADELAAFVDSTWPMASPHGGAAGLRPARRNGCARGSGSRLEITRIETNVPNTPWSETCHRSPAFDSSYMAAILHGCPAVSASHGSLPIEMYSDQLVMQMCGSQVATDRAVGAATTLTLELLAARHGPDVRLDGAASPGVQNAPGS